MEKRELFNWIRLDESTVRINCPTCQKEHDITVEAEVFAGEKPFKLLCPNVDRRYRLGAIKFDFRRRNLKNQGDHLQDIKSQIEKSLLRSLGADNFEDKFERWLSIEYPPLGIIEEYADLLDEVVLCYSMGNYFATMTSAGALVERILNKLILGLRSYHATDPEYQYCQKDSFQDWKRIIPILKRWNVLDQKTEGLIIELKILRNEATHYNSGYDFMKKAALSISKTIELISLIWGIESRNDIFFWIPGEI